MKRLSVMALGAALSCTLALTACSAASPDTVPQDMQQTPAAPSEQSSAGVLSAFSATDLNGNAVDQSVLEEYDLTMVNVWATFCGSCIHEMPALGELAEEYAGQGVQIIGLLSDVMDSEGNIDDGQVKTAQDIVQETGANYLHLLPSSDLYGILSQIYAVPTTFFVDAQGNQVGDAIVQAQSKEQWAETIDRMLAEVTG